MELMEQDSFKKEQEKIISYIEEVLKNYLPKTPSYQKTIYDAMEYSVMAGGKRLRPMMMHQSYIMFGGKDEKVGNNKMPCQQTLHP